MDLLTRRETLFALSAFQPSRHAPSRMSVEGYIFQQYATRQKKPLSDIVEEAFSMARQAGFHNIEINTAFFEESMRARTLSSLHSNGLRMPSVYVGGAMHEERLAEQTLARALEIAALCRPFGCSAVVTNPDPKPGGARKSDDELAVESRSLNRVGQALKSKGYELRVHHHTPQLVENAREWRHILHHTDPRNVALCLDLDWVHQAGLEPLVLLREAGPRAHEIHVRNSKNKLWLESFEDGDIDYRPIAAYLKQQNLQPLVVVELAYRENTPVTHSLADDLRASRIYAERIFGINA
jgi:inosose dehydratase